MITTVNPSTAEKIKDYPEMATSELDPIIQKAHKSFIVWKDVSLSDRATKIRAATKILNDRKEEFAILMAQEMGKPLAQGRAEIKKCIWCCDYYAEEAAKILAPQLIKTDATKSYVVFEPLGILLAIMPWNFPFWQVFRALVPALMVGNPVLLKHAANVAGCALAIEDIIKKAGFPDDIFRTLLISSKQVGDVIDHPLVRAVTITGGTPAGKAVAERSGKNLKKVVLELGGSDPYIVLEDADVELAAATCAASRMINSGQSCIAAKRFFVAASLQKRFEEVFVEHLKKFKMGDPLEEGVTAGPLARHDLRDAIHKQVENSITKGAKLLLGGKIPDSKGAFYPPTVLTNVTKGMDAFDNETFGPVATITTIKNEEDAIAQANDSIFGLGAALFTKDLKRAEKIAQRLEAGSVFINAYVKSDPRLPFGGIKESGYGRELSSFGLLEFVNTKTVYVK
jgi:succinate-semialdehyde dehydrogenase / glutarate-semialdehyde dehydrogenase